MSEPTAKSNLPIQRLRDRAPRSPSTVPLGHGYVDPMGRQWGTVRAMADAYGLPAHTVRRRLRDGESVARALRPVGIEHPVTGERTSLRALAREVGISHAGMAWRAATGVDLMKAPKRARCVMVQRTKSQNGRRSRSKGAAFERWVVSELQRVGLPAERNIAQVRTAAREGCDVEGSPWWIECKVGASPDPRAAYGQATIDRLESMDVRPIVVVWKRDRHEAMASMAWRTLSTPRAHISDEHGPLVTLRFADWLALVAP